MATRPNSFENMPPREEHIPEGPAPVKSQLGKYVGGDMRVPAEKMWMKDLAGDAVRLLPLLPPEAFRGLTKFIQAAPEEKKQEMAGELIGEIESKPVNGPMTAKDQMQILADAIEAVSKRHLPN